jgi:Tfp pilus assembly protein PilE
MKASKSGVLLVEVFIMIILVGLLAAMAIPAFQKVRERANAAAAVERETNKEAGRFEVIGTLKLGSEGSPTFYAVKDHKTGREYLISSHGGGSSIQIR